MTFVDTVASTYSNKNVLVVVGHAYDFMRNNLTNGENQVETGIKQKFVDLCLPTIVETAFRYLFNI